MEIKFWVDEWQMQCCGTPFAMNDEVSWTLPDFDSTWLQVVLGDDLTHGIDKAEEHHSGMGDDAVATVGVVLSIQACTAGMPRCQAKRRMTSLRCPHPEP